MKERLVWLADEHQRPRHAESGDEGYPGGKPVEPVDEVERVHRAYDPEHREDAVHGGRKRGPERAEAEPSPEPRSERDGDLAKQLELRRKAPFVVGEPDEEQYTRERRHAHGMRPHTRSHPAAARGEDVDDEGAEKPEEKRDASAAGDRNLVYASRIGLVDHSEAAVHLAHDRRENERQRKRREKDNRKRRQSAEKIRHFALLLSRSSRDSSAASPASSLREALTVTMTQRSMRLRTLRSTTSRKMRETWLAVLKPSWLKKV